MTKPRLVWVLAGVGLAALVSAAQDCLWFLDKNGARLPGFTCPLGSFCCGDCHYRHCCSDVDKLLTEVQQRRCVHFVNPRAIGGVNSYTSLFILLIAIAISCFMCSCCYLYGRTEPLRQPYRSQEVQMVYPIQTAYPRQPMYPADPRQTPLTGLSTMPGYPPTCSPIQYTLCSPGPPKMSPPSPPPYIPQKH